MASALELPLERVAVDEGAAYGAALLAGVSAGEFSDVEDAVSACVQTTELIEPEPEWVEVYRERRTTFRNPLPGAERRWPVAMTHLGESAALMKREAAGRA